jgi:tRNA dimethylallyltransferase
MCIIETYSTKSDDAAPPTIHRAAAPVVIVGPTAVGKTNYALDLAERVGGEIINADSMQIYKELDIGTAKPGAAELARAPHHLISFANPRRSYSVSDYQKDAVAAISDVLRRGRVPVICGGTGLYVNSLLYDMNFSQAEADDELRGEYERLADDFGNEYIHDILKKKDAKAAERIHPNNRKRVIRAIERAEHGHEGGRIRSFDESRGTGFLKNPEIIVLTRERRELICRIDRRARRMFSDGLEDEIRNLIKGGLTQSHQSMFGIGYKEMFPYINGEISLDEAMELIRIHTRQYAKRQMTWFRRYTGARFVDLTGQNNE